MSQQLGNTSKNIQIPNEILTEIFDQLPPKKQIQLSRVSKFWHATVDKKFKPYHKLANYFPDEVKFKKEQLQKNELTKIECLELIRKFSSKVFYTGDVPGFKLVDPKFYMVKEWEQKICEKFFSLVKEDNWEGVILELQKLAEIDEVEYNEYSIYSITPFADYKMRTLLDWAHKLNCLKFLEGLYRLFPSKQKDLSFKIICKKLKSNEIDGINKDDLVACYPYVIRYGNVELIETWIAQMELKSSNPLCFIIDKEFSITNSADDNSTEKEGFYEENEDALTYAAQCGRLDILKIIYSKWNEILKDGNHSIFNLFKNPLLHAISHGHYDIVNYILDLKQISIEIISREIPLLHVAAAYGHFEMVTLLIQRGVKYIQIADEYPKDYAEKQGFLTPEFEKLHRIELIKNKLYIILDQDPIYPSPDKSLKNTALTLYKYCEKQSQTVFKYTLSRVWEIFHSPTHKRYARKIIEAIKSLDELTQEKFEKIITPFMKEVEKNDDFEAIKQIMLQEFRSQNELKNSETQIQNVTNNGNNNSKIF